MDWVTSMMDIDAFMNWHCGPGGAPERDAIILWLYGPAGAGKTTIA